MNLLFICSQNRTRSLTAEQIYKNHPQHKVDSAGTSIDARKPVSATQLDWADVIFVMEQRHQEILAQRFPEMLKNKKVINLNITSAFEYMQPELVTEIQHEVERYLD